ncbi:MAG: 3-dehydroquinate dehydratase [Deltaproteobacteria bacterium]|nr:3-dehydroquinate dehydratase [Deltaproteobacteria bacterium]
MGASAKRILVLNGPNLNLLGTREPDVYGAATLDDIEQGLADLAKDLGVAIECRQSNQEGQLIDWLHDARDSFDGVVINPGGLTHTSVSLRDGISASLTAAVCIGSVVGFGKNSYALGLRALIDYLNAAG